MGEGSALPKRSVVCAMRAASDDVPPFAFDTRTASPFALRGPIFPRRLRPIESFRTSELKFYRNRVVKQCAARVPQHSQPLHASTLPSGTRCAFLHWQTFMVTSLFATRRTPYATKRS